ACVEPSLRPPAVRPREPPSRDFRNREVTRPRYLNASYRRDWLAEQGAERERLYPSRPLISDVQPLSHLVSSAAPGSLFDRSGWPAARESCAARGDRDTIARAPAPVAQGIEQPPPKR